jgi:hypothetical protein
LSRLRIAHQAIYFSEFGKDVRDFLAQCGENAAEELVQYIQSPWLRVPEPIAI